MTQLPLQTADDPFLKSYKQLNDLQREAVDSIEGPVLVLAGAGTGKTQIIAMRIAKILKESQLEPYNILCLTFTNSGVRAMRERLRQIIGRTADNVEIHTFHSFCNAVIQSHPEDFPRLKREAEVLSDIERIEVVREILEQLPASSKLRPFGDNYFYLKEIINILPKLKHEHITPARYEEAVEQQRLFFKQHQQDFVDLKQIHYTKLSDSTFQDFLAKLKRVSADFPLVPLLEAKYAAYEAGEFADERKHKSARTQLRNEIFDLYAKNSEATVVQKQQELATIYVAYQQALQQRNRYDHEDMITFVLDALKENENLLRDYQEQFQYILVDEFQDTNSAQNELLDMLGSYFDSPNIFVVGDDDQSIYRFQGASLENVMQFYAKYQSQLKLIVLQQNYRSHQKILDTAEALIANNKQRAAGMIPGINKRLIAAEAKEVHPLELQEFVSHNDELYFVAARIKELLAAGTKTSEIAVLYRQNNDVEGLIELFKKLGINYSLEKGRDVLKIQLIKQLLQIIRYLSDPENQQELFRLLNFDLFQLPPVDLARLAHYSGSLPMPMSAAIASAENLQEAGILQPQLFVDLSTKLACWRQQMLDQDPLTFFLRFIQDSGFIKYVLTLPEKFIYLSALTRLYDKLKNLQGTYKNYSFDQFSRHLDLLEEYHYEINDKVADIYEDAVRLMTVHGAKGLEFEHVFIINCITSRWEKNGNRDKIRLPMGLLQSQFLPVSADEEERRLFYVALTRAKSHLYISYAQLNYDQRDQTVSSFTREIADFIDKHSEVEHPDEHKATRGLELLYSADAERDYSAEGRTFLAGILSHYRLSPTHLNSYQECPRCFYFKTILRIPELKDKNAAFGTAVHAALRDLVLDFKIQHQLPGVEYLVRQFESALQREHMTTTDYTESLHKGREILPPFYTRYGKVFSGESLVEQNFRKYRIEVEGVPITGRIDRIDLLPGTDHPVSVVDYKTGNPDYKSTDLKEGSGTYYKQLVFYKLLADNARGFPYRVRSGTIMFIEPSKRKHDFVAKDYALTAEATTTLVVEIKSVYSAIMNLEFDSCNTKDCPTAYLHELPWKI